MPKSFNYLLKIYFLKFKCYFFSGFLELWFDYAYTRLNIIVYSEYRARMDKFYIFITQQFNYV